MLNTINVFVSYALEDQQMWKELEKYLSSFLREGIITIWDSKKNIYGIGREKDRDVASHLDAADLILLLVSPNYLANDQLYYNEMMRAMERQRYGDVWVLPILLHPVHWQEEPFSILQMLPHDARPISLWRKKSEAFLQVASAIRMRVTKILTPPDTKMPSAFISERVNTPRLPLRVEETYTLNLNLEDLEESVTKFGGQISPTDIPEQGLDTEWSIYSYNVELGPVSTDVTIASIDTNVWTAQFSLHVPHEGDSPSIQLHITPKSLENTHLNVFVYANGELYRDFRVEFTVDETHIASQPQSTEASMVKTQTIYASPNQLGLDDSYDWQRPPSELEIVVLDSNKVFVKGKHIVIIGEYMDWSVRAASVVEPIEQVRRCADELRANMEKYFEDIDVTDLKTRLEHFQPQTNWAHLKTEVDDHHQQVWDEMIINCEELQNLASWGHALYEQFFPEGSRLQSVLDVLEPGSSLYIHWTQKSGSDWIPSVPWGLMYAKKPEQPIDPLYFLGLRFRIQYTSYAPKGGRVKDRPRDLGNPDRSYRASCLYWERKEGNLTTTESKWQHSLWADWANQVLIPKNYLEPDLEQKKALLKLIKGSASGPPMSILYFYCKYNFKKSANQHELRFSENNNASDKVTTLELLQSDLSANPLVFMNACTTSASDPYYANALQQLFFDKGCSAYLGTETKVPIHLAGCFAAIFFHFFYRKIKDWPEPISAGEAMAQTRLFLWTQYKNLGGLFYTYINQSQLFMADATELENLRR